MCGPWAVPLIGMAVSAAGSVMNAKNASDNQNAMIKARNDATEANFAQQDVIGKHAQEVFANTLGGFDRTKQTAGLGAAQGKREAAVTGNTGASQTNEYAPAPGSAPQVVKSDIARKIGEAVQAGRSRGLAFSKLAGQQDVNLGNSIDLGRSRGVLGQDSSFAGGIANLLPLQQGAAANNAYRNPSMLGDMLKLGGMGASMYGGATGLFSGAGSDLANAGATDISGTLMPKGGFYSGYGVA